MIEKSRSSTSFDGLGFRSLQYFSLHHTDLISFMTSYSQSLHATLHRIVILLVSEAQIPSLWMYHYHFFKKELYLAALLGFCIQPWIQLLCSLGSEIHEIFHDSVTHRRGNRVSWLKTKGLQMTTAMKGSQLSRKMHHQLGGR